MVGVVVASMESGQNLNFAVPINSAKGLVNSPVETLISALPRRSDTEVKRETKTDPLKLAVQEMSGIADEIRACEEWGNILPTKEKKPRYTRMHWGPPANVRFDIKASDSLVTPFQGIVEFSIPFGMSYYSRSQDEATTAEDIPVLSSMTRHRHVFRIGASGVQLDYRSYFDDVRRKDWVLEQETPQLCWERAGYN